MISFFYQEVLFWFTGRYSHYSCKSISMSHASLCLAIFSIVLGTLTFVHSCRPTSIAQKSSPFPRQKLWMRNLWVLSFPVLNLIISCRDRTQRPTLAFSSQRWDWASHSLVVSIRALSVAVWRMWLYCQLLHYTWALGTMHRAGAGLSLHKGVSGWNCLALFV